MYGYLTALICSWVVMIFLFCILEDQLEINLFEIWLKVLFSDVADESDESLQTTETAHPPQDVDLGSVQEV